MEEKSNKKGEIKLSYEEFILFAFFYGYIGEMYDVVMNSKIYNVGLSDIEKKLVKLDSLWLFGKMKKDFTNEELEDLYNDYVEIMDNEAMDCYPIEDDFDSIYPPIGECLNKLKNVSNSSNKEDLPF